MKRLAFVALLCVFGCGGYPPRGADDRPPKPVVLTCFVVGLERVQLEFAPAGGCAAVEQWYALARQMMNDRGLVPAEAQAPFAGTRVLVIDESFILHDGQMLSGRYEPGPMEITLAGAGRSLLHELLHDWQFARGISNSGAHPGWDTNGYWAADGIFQGTARALE